MKLQAFSLSLILAVVSSAWAQMDSRSVSIALPNQAGSVKKPASDLLKDGKELDVGLAAQMAERGFDLSTLNPTDNKFWQNKVYPISDASTRNYPKAATGVKFVSSEAAIKFTSLHLVQSSENPNLYFRLGISFYSQSMMMRAALLRKLGFFVPSPQYYSNLKVSFKSEDEKQKFLKQMSDDLGGIDLSARQWILSDNKTDHSLTLSSSMLEVVSTDNFDLYLGSAPDPEVPSQLPLVQRYSRNRAFRALIVPYALVDVPESVNRYSVRFGTVSTGFVSISHVAATSFQSCTYEDARWILRKLQTLSLKDYQDIVKEAHYPDEIEPLVLAKLINRSRDALSLFQLQASVPEQSLEINSSKGLVQAGKVTREVVDGYPQRFAHGERKSPFEQGDFMRFLGIEGKSSLIASVLGKVNEQLQFVNTAQDSRAQAYQDFARRLADRVRANPTQPIYKEVVSYPARAFGLNINASRHVSTGTYSGSTAPVQLVDNLSIGAGLGLFRTLENVGGAGVTSILGAGANVAVVRDYTHVRPILSMKDTKNVPWKDILIPSYMKDLSSVLVNAEKVGEDGSKQKSIDAFLAGMQDGEVFSISDSLATSASLTAASSIDVLLGLQPFSVLNAVTMGADASRVVIRQVSFHRVINDNFNGVNVYVRELKNKGAGLEMNANFFINVLKIRAQASEADIKTDGFVLKYKDAFSGDADPDSEVGKKLAQTREDLRTALLPLFKNNNPDLLYSKFATKKFQVEHNLKEKELKLKFLAWRFSKFKEDHIVELTYPKSEAHPELDPKKEKITLFSSKRGELKGRDLMGFSYDLVDGVLTQQGQAANIRLARANAGDNPANAPMGKAYWRLINTEADLTTNGASNYPSVGMIQHVWGGWSLKKDKFMQVISDIKKQFENTEIASYQIINPQEFVNVKSVDFYRVTANLSVVGNGLNKIRDLLLQPQMDNAPAQRPPVLSRVIQKIRCANKTEADCNEKFRIANDKEFFNEILKMFGNGDLETGRARYKEICEEPKHKNNADVQFYPVTLYKGAAYDCLSDWTMRLIKLGHEYPSDKAEQTKWMTEVLSILDENIPLPQLLKYIGSENYIFLVRINGFRVGDEDGDLQYFSNSVGDPQKDYTYAGGLINLYIKKTGLMPTELDRTLGGFQ